MASRKPPVASSSATRRGSQTRERILVAASQVFAEEGFAGARVDQIAAAAGVNKALLYYHVGNKQDLYTSVLIRNFDRVDHAISRAAKYEGSARNRLGKIVAAVTTVLKDHPDHPRIVLREFASAGTNLQPQVLERIIKILTTVREVLSSGIRDGEFRATDPVLTHITLVGASLFLNAVTPLRERIAEIGGPGIGLPAEDSDFGGFLTDLLLHGITTPTSGESE